MASVPPEFGVWGYISFCLLLPWTLPETEGRGDGKGVQTWPAGAGESEAGGRHCSKSARSRALSLTQSARAAHVLGAGAQGAASAHGVLAASPRGDPVSLPLSERRERIGPCRLPLPASCFPIRQRRQEVLSPRRPQSPACSQARATRTLSVLPQKQLCAQLHSLTAGWRPCPGCGSSLPLCPRRHMASSSVRVLRPAASVS